MLAMLAIRLERKKKRIGFYGRRKRDSKLNSSTPTNSSPCSTSTISATNANIHKFYG